MCNCCEREKYKELNIFDIFVLDRLQKKGYDYGKGVKSWILTKE